MKLKLMMRDQEYQNALAARLGRVCSEIYVEIGNDFSQEEDTLIITDIGRGRLGPGMVFLHKECVQEMEGSGPYTLFKYDSVGMLLFMDRPWDIADAVDLHGVCGRRIPNGHMPSVRRVFCTTAFQSFGFFCSLSSPFLPAHGI